MVDLLPTVNAGIDRSGAGMARITLPADRDARRVMAEALRCEARRVLPSQREDADAPDKVARTMRASSLLHTASLVEHAGGYYRDQPGIERRFVGSQTRPITPAQPALPPQASAVAPKAPAVIVDQPAAPQEAPVRPGRRLTLTLLIRAAAQVSGLSQGSIVSASRTKPLVRLRHAIFWLAHRELGRSLPAIGRRLGGRDHTTVLWGVCYMDSALATGDPGLTALVSAIRQTAQEL